MAECRTTGYCDWLLQDCLGCKIAGFAIAGLELDSGTSAAYASVGYNRAQLDERRMIEIQPFGACLLTAPVGELLVQGRAATTWHRLGTNGPSIYTLDEAIQAAEFFRGDFEVPPELRPLCSLPAKWSPAEAAKTVAATPDLVLIEVNSPVRIAYGQYSLNRAEVNHRYLVPLADQSEELHLISNEWYLQGLMAGNATARVTAAEQLVKVISQQQQIPDWELACDVLRRAVPQQRDLDEIVEGLARLREVVNGPLAMVTYTHQYMPDGRPLPWPPDFVDLQVAAARRLGLTMFEPSKIVRSHGVARAMRDDYIHYQDAFAPVLADALFDFISNVVDARGVGEIAAPRQLVLHPPYAADGGSAWSIALPSHYCSLTDTEEAPFRSTLQLLEDGHALGPAHTVHALIREQGGGGYSFWKSG
ncbi:MAG: hypothetical protein ACM3JG_07980, partial [Thiohalocapsa sp.]